MTLVAWGCGTDTASPAADLDASEIATDGGNAGDPDASSDDAPTVGAPTYHGGIRALIEQECVSCHTTGGAAPFPLETWADVEPLRGALVAVVSSGSMPPWTPATDCRDIDDDRALDADEIALFTAWRDAGFPEGDPADYVPPAPRGGRALGEPDLVLAPTEAYTPNTALPDDYRCLLLDHTFDEQTFFVASDVIPGERRVVHHVLFYVVPPDDVAAVERRDAADAGPGYTCFGGTGGSGGPIAGWVPGMVASQYPEGAAVVIEPGSRVVMQVHYNTLALESAEEPPADTTRLALWLLPAGQLPTSRVDILGVPQSDFLLPAGEPRVEVTREFTIPWFAEVIGVAPHMHTLGTEIRGRVDHRTGDSSCLVDIPAWDFNWQQFYRFTPDAVAQVRPGDKFQLECVYDNSAEHQPIVNGRQLDPRDVRWGEGTLDEMCLMYLIVRTPFAVDDGTLCGAYDRCYRGCDGGDADCFLGCLPSSGEECASCVLDAYNTCVARECPRPGLALLDCLRDCDEDTTSCLAGECHDALDDVYACIDPIARAGDCNAELAACELEY
ncbi:MAG: hypothetical protein H6698_06995 [Myxococcales bacterium]|nr:hypothetical protein [Myxococcales bacterium]MCB9531434.1 hypothetical protein [Myxococcales bacterium]MCB9534055.1 hypothetical protein [Myxococcales bacterium]